MQGSYASISRSGKVWKMETIVWKNILVSKTMTLLYFLKHKIMNI